MLYLIDLLDTGNYECECGLPSEMCNCGDEC